MIVSQAFKVHSAVPAAADATRRPLIWLSLVCLDAPLVAIAWQEMFAKAFNSPISIAERMALFLTAWCIYLADRVVDCLSTDRSETETLRSAFCRRYLPLLLSIAAVVGIADLAVIATSIGNDILYPGVV